MKQPRVGVQHRHVGTEIAGSGSMRMQKHAFKLHVQNLKLYRSLPPTHKSQDLTWPEKKQVTTPPFLMKH